MSTALLSVVFIMGAFVLYTVAVWAERLAARLKSWHLVVFWLGFAADGAGTALMRQIARSMGGEPDLVSAVHGITGALAIVLMLFHCVWATVVLYRNEERAIRSFHRFSTLVWAIWLIPFVIGGAMQGFK